MVDKVSKRKEYVCYISKLYTLFDFEWKKFRGWAMVNKFNLKPVRFGWVVDKDVCLCRVWHALVERFCALFFTKATITATSTRMVSHCAQSILDSSKDRRRGWRDLVRGPRLVGLQTRERTLRERSVAFCLSLHTLAWSYQILCRSCSSCRLSHRSRYWLPSIVEFRRGRA